MLCNFLGVEKVLTLTYMFAHKFTKYEDVIRETSDDKSISSKETIANWLSYCREVCMTWCDEYFAREGKIGGDKIVVEVDECKVGKRKYNRGRFKEGSWILGLIEANTGDDAAKRRGGKLRLELCPGNKRDANTLLPLIAKHVKPGTIVVTDLWKAYNNLPEYEYEHFTVNHSRHFVDPASGANTQTIESTWRVIKYELPKSSRNSMLADHLCEFLWRRHVRHFDLDPFYHFVDCIIKTYPPSHN